MAPVFELWLPALRAAARRRSFNLGLHGLGPRRPALDPTGLWREPHRFVAEVRLFLAAGFRFVTVTELAELADGGDPPPGYATLSFDDGMQDNHEALLPLLQHLDVRATVYAVAGLLGAPNPYLAPAAQARLMNAGELRALHRAGMEIGAHSVTHPDMSALAYEACVREARESREALEHIIDAPVRTFSYPFGRYHADAVRAVRDAGFRAAVTCDIRPDWDPFRLPRTMIGAKDGTATVALKAMGLYKPLVDNPPARVVKRASRPARRWVRAARAR